MSHVIITGKALQASIALIAIPHREDVVADKISLHGVWPVVDLDTVLWIKVVDIHRDVDQWAEIKAFEAILDYQWELLLYFDLIADVHICYHNRDIGFLFGRLFHAWDSRDLTSSLRF
jgi:hypothetical protein